MYRRKPQKTFADYFSPAERGFTDFMTRNAVAVRHRAFTERS
jgi:hypothetical protein